MLKRVSNNTVVNFGKHKGRSIGSIFSGERNISKEDLRLLYSTYGDDLLPNGDGYRLEYNLLKGLREDFMSQASLLLNLYLPEPSYIDWLLTNTEFYMPIDELRDLERQPVHMLSRVSVVQGILDEELTPWFVAMTHTFYPKTIDFCVKRAFIWQHEQDSRPS